MDLFKMLKTYYHFILDYFMSMLVLLYSIFYFINKKLSLTKRKLKIGIIFITLLVVYLSNYLYKDTTIATLVSKYTYITIGIIFIIMYIFIMPIILKIKNKQKIT